MPWARLDEHMPQHRKIRRLSDAAFRLHVSAICWSSAHLTDGRVATAELAYIADIKQPTKAAAELVAHGAWEQIPEGWVIHDYLEYNPSADKVEADRAAAAERQRNAREKRWGSQRESRRDARQQSRRDSQRDSHSDSQRDSQSETNSVPLSHSSEISTADDTTPAPPETRPTPTDQPQHPPPAAASRRDFAVSHAAPSRISSSKHPPPVTAPGPGHGEEEEDQQPAEPTPAWALTELDRRYQRRRHDIGDPDSWKATVLADILTEGPPPATPTSVEPSTPGNNDHLAQLAAVRAERRNGHPNA